MDARQILGKNLRKLRQERGLSQERFALEHGFDRTYISGIERGERNPTVLVVGRLASALEVEIALLLRVPSDQ